MFSRIGSETYYASYDRKLEELQAYSAELREKQSKLRLLQQKLLSTVFWYCTAPWVAMVAYAAWVIRQPPETFGVRGQFLRVAPVYAWPAAVCTACALGGRLTDIICHFLQLQAKASQRSMRAMITDLKESTHYDKTLQLLRKYDPDFAAEEAKQRARMTKQQNSPARHIHFSSKSDSPSTPRQVGALAGSALRGAGSRVMPALDYIATNLMGDSPALTNALREAQSEGEALRRRVEDAEARIVDLEDQNETMRKLLGEKQPWLPFRGFPVLPSTPSGPKISKLPMPQCAEEIIDESDKQTGTPGDSAQSILTPSHGPDHGASGETEVSIGTEVGTAEMIGDTEINSKPSPESKRSRIDVRPIDSDAVAAIATSDGSSASGNTETDSVSAISGWTEVSERCDKPEIRRGPRLRHRK